MGSEKADWCEGSGLVEELKQAAKEVVVGVEHAPALLRLIDALHRLGIAHYFRQEIHRAFCRLLPSVASDLDLFHTSLQFRLLRQHAFPITPVVFDKFIDSNGKFLEHIAEDAEGLLSLYEASHLGFSGEQVLEGAKDFSSKHLNLLLSQNKLKGNLRGQVQLSLQLPLHWRMPRIEARYFIDIYQQDVGMQHLVLLRLAKLDYNLLHSLYLDELKELTEWWTKVKAKYKPGFPRENLLVECYFWAMGSVPEFEFSKGRKNLAAYGIIATILDDMYDIQGSIEDLQKFTHAIKLWDIKAVNGLPDYMKVIYSAIVENGDQTARHALEHLGLNIDFLPYIKEQWASYCRALMMEARWARERYMPSFDDYMNNAWVSIGIVPGMVYALLAQAHEVAEYLPDCLDNWANSELFYWPSFITRLLDDLTSTDDEMERGEANAMVCYMVERGAPQEEAKVHMKGLLNNAWTRLMELGNPQAPGHIPNSLLGVALSMCRSVQKIFLHGDWFGARTQPNQDWSSQVEELKQAAKELAVGVEEAPALLRLIDALHRLEITHISGKRSTAPSAAY
nr:terpene synthase 22 [Aquilaria agallochum]